MSDQSQGPDWWLASDGKWYPPESLPAASPPPAAAPNNAPEAVGALVLGIASVFLYFIFLVPLGAIILGVKGRREISRSAGALKGNGMAIAGIVLGGLMLFAWVGSTMPN